MTGCYWMLLGWYKPAMYFCSSLHNKQWSAFLFIIKPTRMIAVKRKHIPIYACWLDCNMLHLYPHGIPLSWLVSPLQNHGPILDTHLKISYGGFHKWGYPPIIHSRGTPMAHDYGHPHISIFFKKYRLTVFPINSPSHISPKNPEYP